MVLSFVFFAFGLYLFVPSARMESFALFLVASFISGIGNALLQAALNPYVTICGPIESAAKRISIMIIFNRGGWAIAPIFPLLFGWLNDVFGDIQMAYWLFFPSLLFMMFYAFKGHMIGLKGMLKVS